LRTNDSDGFFLTEDDAEVGFFTRYEKMMEVGGGKALLQAISHLPTVAAEAGLRQDPE